MDKVLHQALANWALADAFVGFGAAMSPRHLKYMDLVEAPATHERSQVELQGVIENSGKAAVYVARCDSLGTAPQAANADLAQLVRTLACRADAPYLAVVEPGVTTVYHVAFYADHTAPSQARRFTDGSDSELRALLNGLYRADERDSHSVWLDDLLFTLLSTAAETLREAISTEAMDDGRLLSIIGRALFARFLVDRDILKAGDIARVCPGARTAEDLFASATATARTFEWLDQTFNGDLLDLGTRDYSALMTQLGDSARVVCSVLSRIMLRSPDGQLMLDWDGLQFRHIPVDVLSQAYEHFAHQYSPQRARETSIHFTPRAIAEMAVDGAFSALPQDARSRARVIDPAAGAGVFLVLCLRRMIAEEWLQTGIRPRRRRIRQMLTQQLCGLDINPQSIKVAALSLYLAALELDPQPQPLSELRFERLFETTLRCVDSAHLGEADDAHLGSLSQVMTDLGPFDIVIGNPPWTALAGRDKRLLDQIALIHCRDVPNTSASQLTPNQWPDLAFMWRSLQWCRPGGIIALLVNARLLFSQEALPARKFWFSRTRVTGVLNGMALRKDEKIWATNSQPFCALVSINRPPQEGDAFYFLTPRSEPALSGRREFRLDPHAAQAVPVDAAVSNRTVFKTLSRGSSLDVHLVERLRGASDCTLGDLVQMRQGFIAGKQNLQDASALANYRVLNATDLPTFSVLPLDLPTVAERYPDLKFQWPRSEQIYKGPLLLFREAPKHDLANRGGLWVDGDLVFSRSFYGMSADADQAELARYVYLLSYSDLLAYWVLMTSAKFGVERDTYHMEDYQNFPVPPLDRLPHELRGRIPALAARVAEGEEPWNDLEDFVAEIYDLDRYDTQLINDALVYESPYTASKEQALLAVTHRSPCVQAFSRALRDVLRAAGLARAEVEVCGREVDHPVWQFLRVAPAPLTHQHLPESVHALLGTQSEALMSSEIRIQSGPNEWFIGRLRQERYWSPSKARLLALDLLERAALTTKAA